MTKGVIILLSPSNAVLAALTLSVLCTHACIVLVTIIMHNTLLYCRTYIHYLVRHRVPCTHYCPAKHTYTTSVQINYGPPFKNILHRDKDKHYCCLFVGPIGWNLNKHNPSCQVMPCQLNYQQMPTLDHEVKSVTSSFIIRSFIRSYVYKCVHV